MNKKKKKKKKDATSDAEVEPCQETLPRKDLVQGGIQGQQPLIPLLIARHRTGPIKPKHGLPTELEGAGLLRQHLTSSSEGKSNGARLPRATKGTLGRIT